MSAAASSSSSLPSASATDALSSGSSSASAAAAFPPLPEGARIVESEQALITLFDTCVRRAPPDCRWVFRCRSPSHPGFCFRAVLGEDAGPDWDRAWERAHVREECWLIGKSFTPQDTAIRQGGATVGGRYRIQSFVPILPGNPLIGSNPAILDEELVIARMASILDGVSDARDRIARNSSSITKSCVVVAVIAIAALVHLMARK